MNALVLPLACMLIASCGGRAKLDPQPEADACSAATAEYKLRWRAALVDDVRDLGLSADDIESLVAGQIATLPTTDEVRKLRELYALVDLFLFTAPWPLAFDAAEAAIAQCTPAGGSTHRLATPATLMGSKHDFSRQTLHARRP